MRFLIAALRGIGRLCGATFATGFGLCWWLTRTCWEGWTGRSFAAEAAERQAQAVREAEAIEAQAQAQADRDNTAARHEEAANLAEQQLAATQDLMDELRRAARMWGEPAGEHRTQARVAAPMRWVPEEDVDPEPEGGTPAPAYA